MKESLKKKMACTTNLPKDVIFGVPIITMTGQLEVCVENYKGIMEYTDTLIRIRSKVGQIRVTGRNMQIEYYTNDEMKITGQIKSVEYS
ncbi:sporulation protein YqfC [Lachnospiraceae bacterium 2_1_46FAA]|nr:sporulation protein YqfC [Lachnospiraceae bacterium 2_1_46FAA]